MSCGWHVWTCCVSNSHLSGWAVNAALVSWRRTQTRQPSALRASCRSWHLLRWMFPSSRHQRCRDANKPQTEWATILSWHFHVNRQQQGNKGTSVPVNTHIAEVTQKVSSHSLFSSRHTKRMFNRKYIHLHRNKLDNWNSQSKARRSQ